MAPFGRAVSLPHDPNLRHRCQRPVMGRQDDPKDPGDGVADKLKLDLERWLAQVPDSSFPPKASDEPVTLGQIADGETHQEGAVHRVLVNRYERDPKARAKCIEHHGACCAVCNWTSRDVMVRSGKASFTYITHALSGG